MPIPIAAIIAISAASAAAKGVTDARAANKAGDHSAGGGGAAAGNIQAIDQNQQQLAQQRTLFNQQMAQRSMGDSPLAQILGGQQPAPPPEIPQVGQNDQLRQLLQMLQQQRGGL